MLAYRIAKESLENTTFHTLARRHKKAFNTVMGIVHRVLRGLPTSIDVALRFQPAWSGVLVVDGKVVRVYDEFARLLDRSHYTEDELAWRHKARFLCGIDYGSGDLPHYDLAETESKIDLVLYFRGLKSIHYPLKAIVCDGNPSIPVAARHVFGPGIIVQRCTRHFLQDLRQLLPSEKEQQGERALLKSIISQIKQVIEAATLEEAGAAYLVLRQTYRQYRHPIALAMYKRFEATKDPLTAHLQYPKLGLPHTSNDIENLFMQLAMRLKLIRRFYNFHYARSYLNAWALRRRFTPYVACKGQRKYRNGKSPLQLAAVDTTGIDYLKLRR